MASPLSIISRRAAVLGSIKLSTAEVMEDFTDAMLAEAKQPYPRGAPVDTANMSRSQASDKDTKRMVFRVFTRGIGYAKWVHLGTARMAARPWLQTAFRATVAKFQDPKKWAGRR